MRVGLNEIGVSRWKERFQGAVAPGWRSRNPALGPILNDASPFMRVYEAKISYTMVSPGETVHLSKPPAVAEYLKSALEQHPTQEAFYAVYLNRRNRPLGRHLITLGTLTSTLVSPREVFRGAILASASALVVAHNHPSGDPSPSRNDLSMTRQLLEASKILDIELLDHIIVGSKDADPQGAGLFSFREAGIL